MTIPDSLQIFGDDVFVYCSKLVPSSIYINDVYNDDDVTSEVVANLRSEMSLDALLSGNNFLNTDDFRMLIVPYLQGNALMPIKLASKPWSRVADEFTDDGVESGAMIVHDGSDLSWDLVEAREESPLLVTRVIVLLNITKVGGFACYYAVNLVVVDIPEGVESIGEWAFRGCRSLTTVSFPKTLTLIGEWCFFGCTSLENVDLLYTNLQVLYESVFCRCSGLKSMMIPDSLQILGIHVFHACSKLVPSNIDVNGFDNDIRLKSSPTSAPYNPSQRKLKVIKKINRRRRV